MDEDRNGSRIAGRDYYERCTVHIVEDHPESDEFGPCKICRRMIWVGATKCPHCGYDPAVEQARWDAIRQQRQRERKERVMTLIGLFFCSFVYVGFPIAEAWFGKNIDALTLGAIVGLAITAGIGSLLYRPDIRRDYGV